MAKKQKSNRPLIILLAVLIAALLIIPFVIYDMQKQNELEQIYSTFTCGCCEGSLLASNEICALGYKEKIEQFQEDGLRGRELYIASVKLLGMTNIIDQDLMLRTYTDIQERNLTSRPILTLKEDYVNFGNVSESEMAFVIKEFRVTNTGDETLYITNVKTSCSCLNTKIVTNEKEGPTMSRFSFPYGMVVPIEPNEDVRLRVTYDARVNSFFRGHEVRYVYIESTDPVTPINQITVEVTHVD